MEVRMDDVVDTGFTRPNRLAEDSPTTTPSRSPTPFMLPEDDGMEPLRQKMREIHNLALSTEEKARQMHLLMTRDYRALSREPDAMDIVPDITLTPVYTATSSPSNPYNIHPADLEPSYCPEPIPSCDDEDMAPDEDSRHALGCQHYTRNVKVQCFDCKLWFPCRHCHDSSPNLPFPHQLNRKMTENMLCMMCKTPQPAGEECISCGVETAYYYCPKCKLWDNDSTKRIYHCDDCGICRRGEGLGKDYVHCKRCNVCISISTSADHPCIERATDCDCPLCLEYLFSSALPVVSLLCGHYMHATCYKDLMTVTYRCPVCNKSAVNMELQWRKLDDEIRLQPMPEEDFEPLPVVVASHSDPANATANTDIAMTNTLSVPSPPPSNPHRRHVPRKVWIGCNDCGGRGWSPFHWLGLKCAICDGYNTTQTTPLGNASTVARVPGTYHTQRQHDFTGLNAIRSFGDGSGEGGGAGLGLESAVVAVDALGQPIPQSQQVTDGNIDGAHSHDHQEWMPSPSQPGSGRSYFYRAEAEEGNSGPAAATSYYYTTYGPPSLLRPELRASLSTYGPSLSMLRPELRASLSDFGGVPYDMVMRLGRSLSPMRYYIDGLDIRTEAQPSAASAEGPGLLSPHSGAPAAEEFHSLPGSGERSPGEVSLSGSVSPKGEAGSEGPWRPDRGWFDSFSAAVGRQGEEDEEEEEDEDEDEDEDDDDDDDDDEEDEDEDEESDEESDVASDNEDELDLPGHL